MKIRRAKKTKQRLADRRERYDRMKGDTKGTKRPGSRNPHKGS